MNTYNKALPEMMSMVERVASEHHEHLDGRKIAVIMQDEATTRKGGSTVLGWASVPSARLQPILDDDYDFVICLARDKWEKLDEKQKTALVDHELCHCRIDDKLKAYVIDHDYEEFVQILHRHGLWRQDRIEKAIQTVFKLSEADTRKTIKVGTIGK